MTARTVLLTIAVALCAGQLGELAAQDPVGQPGQPAQPGQPGQAIQPGPGQPAPAGPQGREKGKDEKAGEEAEAEAEARLRAYRSWVMELIREVFAEDYRNEAAGRLDPTFGRRLLELGLATQNDGIAREMLLAEAARAAPESGDMATAIAALDGLGAGVAVRQRALAVAADRVVAPADRSRLVEQVLIVADGALDSDEYGAAGELIGLGRRVAAGDHAMLEVLQTWAARVRAEEALYSGYRDNLAAVAGGKGGTPADLSRAGEYLCLIQGRWHDGLWALACHQREDVKQVAMADLGNPTDPTSRLALADRWWALSEREDGTRRDRMRERALVWYLAVMPRARGLDLLKIQKRVDDGAQLGLGRLEIAQKCTDLGWYSLARRILRELSEFVPSLSAPELERIERLEHPDRSGR